jgi:hypothetical protein
VLTKTSVCPALWVELDLIAVTTRLRFVIKPQTGDDSRRRKTETLLAALFDLHGGSPRPS